jgi:head-tail adaptor
MTPEQSKLIDAMQAKPIVIEFDRLNERINLLDGALEESREQVYRIVEQLAEARKETADAQQLASRERYDAQEEILSLVAVICAISRERDNLIKSRH